MAGALVLLVAPVMGALVIWGIWWASQVLGPSTTTVIVEAPRPTLTPIPPTALPPFLVQPTTTLALVVPTPAPPTATPAVVVNPEPTVAPPTSVPPTIASPAVAVAPTVAASPAPPVAVAPPASTRPAASPATVIAGPPAAPSPVPAVPTVVAAAPPIPTDVVHVVEAGETIARIALRYGVEPDAIVRANGLTERTRTLRIGDRLIVPGVTATPSANIAPLRAAAATRTPTPAPTATPDEEEDEEQEHVYVAEDGDSLSSIAERFGIPLDALLQANGFDDANRAVQVGERIVIPGTEAPPTP